MQVKLTEIAWPENRLRKVGDYQELAKSMEETEQLYPLILVPLEEPKANGTRFKLVCGMHRFLAAWINDWEYVEADVKHDWDEDKQIQVEIEENLCRKELDPLERAEHMAQLYYLKEKQGKVPKRGQRVTKVEKYSHMETRQERAAKFGVTDRSERDYRKIGNAFPKSIRDQLKQTEAGRKHRNLKYLANKTGGEQLVALAMIVWAESEGKRISAQDALRRGMRLWSQRLSREATAPPEGPYKTIVIDPPWSGEDSGDVDPYGKVAPNYNTMSLDEIAALPVADLAEEDDCDLYLWVTDAMLPKAFSLIEGWGFKFHRVLVWHKHRQGTGRYFVGQHELCLFAKRGTRHMMKAGVPSVVKTEEDPGDTVFEGERTDHSVKPSQFYEMVKEVSPAPRLEMFAREEREGYVSWGTMERRVKEAV